MALLPIGDFFSQLYIAATSLLSEFDADNIAVDQADCEAMFQKLVELMPPGDILWSRDPNTEMGKMLTGLAVELCRVQKAITIAVDREADPSLAVYMLPEWQALVQLDDDFDPDPAVRRAAVVELLKYRSGSNVAYWTQLAEGMGFTSVEINDPKDPFRMGDEMGHELKGGQWFYTMEVEAKGGTPASREALKKAVRLRLHATWSAVFSLSA